MSMENEQSDQIRLGPIIRQRQDVGTEWTWVEVALDDIDNLKAAIELWKGRNDLGVLSRSLPRLRAVFEDVVTGYEGNSTLEQQQAVYKALRDALEDKTKKEDG